jgi:hypothetical protein
MHNPITPIKNTVFAIPKKILIATSSMKKNAFEIIDMMNPNENRIEEKIIKSFDDLSSTTLFR